jgi:hypothetical protein
MPCRTTAGSADPKPDPGLRRIVRNEILHIQSALREIIELFGETGHVRPILRTGCSTILSGAVDRWLQTPLGALDDHFATSAPPRLFLPAWRTKSLSSAASRKNVTTHAAASARITGRDNPENLRRPAPLRLPASPAKSGHRDCLRRGQAQPAWRDDSPAGLKINPKSSFAASRLKKKNTVSFSCSTSLRTGLIKII